jgi:hypothetical protein
MEKLCTNKNRNEQINKSNIEGGSINKSEMVHVTIS